MAAASGYELIGASAVVLRIISASRPDDALEALDGRLGAILGTNDQYAASAVEGRGWLCWTTNGLRASFLRGLGIERRLLEFVRNDGAGAHGSWSFRWGIWVDQYLVPVGEHGAPMISEPAARAIFDFEPEDRLLCSEAVYEINRQWEHFVCVPRRLPNDREGTGYRLLDHKQPSALAHAKAADAGPFIGRGKELGFLSDCQERSGTGHVRAALIAAAGSGKTRLVREWQRRNPKLRMLTANFSLFGGDAPAFASQLAPLPPDDLTIDALVKAAQTRVRAERIDVLVLDDLHWADGDSVVFLERLLRVLSSRAMLVLLVTRPSGRAVLDLLHPTVELELSPLSAPVAQKLARRMAASPEIAAIAASRSKGNPLFVEHFTAWARETGYAGSSDGPRNLHQVIAARIAHLSDVRLPDIRRRTGLGTPWDRSVVQLELDALEAEIGLWLDRLETGDYGDRIEASHHLANLGRIDFELFLASMLSGKPRPRSSRLREAIERLMVGSAEQVLENLRKRADVASDTERANILMEARAAADALAERHDWALAAAFYGLAMDMAEPREREELAHRLAACRRRLSPDQFDASSAIKAVLLETEPAVDALRLPEAWAYLGLHCGSSSYFRRAVTAAEAINDYVLASWARRKLAELE